MWPRPRIINDLQNPVVQYDPSFNDKTVYGDHYLPKVLDVDELCKDGFYLSDFPFIKTTNWRFIMDSRLKKVIN